MRILLALAVLALTASAVDAPGDLVKLFGGAEGWGELQEWRQKDILHRYRRFLKLPAEKQAAIRKRGLKEFLAKPRKRFELPAELASEIDKLPDEARPLARKLVTLRLRQVRLDRHLSLVPKKQRRHLFRRLFPEPFVRETAREAHKELESQVSRAMVRRILPRLKKAEAEAGRDLTKKEKAELVRKVTRGEEQRVFEQVRREILRFSSKARDPRSLQRELERLGYPQLERLHLVATPRQRELVRWAVRPESCPLVDSERLAGPRPEDPKKRRMWLQDVRVLGRVDLLTEAGFPPDMVLHLAGAHSPPDFLRGLKAFRDHPKGRKPRR
jgi:hypothetical protein